METAIMSAMCRCCASEGVFKDVKTSYTWMGEEEVYADMLRECFDITLSTSEHCEDGGICEVCITQLRNASNFKKQVLHTEEQFKKHVNNKLFKPSIVKVEVSAEEDNDSDDNNMSAEEGYSGPEFEVPIKTESDEPKSKKRAAASKASTSRAKKAKNDNGESSTKRTQADNDKVITEEKHSHNIIKKREATRSKIRFVTVKAMNTYTPVPKNVEVYKHRSKKPKSRNDKLDKHRTNEPEPRNVELYKHRTNEPEPRNDELYKHRTNEPEPRNDELYKHRTNIKEVILWSNATPIRRYGGIGYMCCYCEDQYPEPTDLKKHTLEKHHDVKKACFMKKVSMNQFVIRLDITSLHCKICDINLDTLEQLMKHLKTDHHKTIYTDIKNQIIPFKFGTEFLQCCICLNTFTKFKMLLEHMNLHYRNYICEICDIGFVNFQGLKCHRLRHETGTFICDHCGQVFDTNVKRKAHERTMHISKTAPKCGYCNETFSEYRKKEAHLVSVHGLKLPTPQCQACDRVFKDRKLLRLHVKRDHLLDRPHKCSECDMSFFQSTELKYHMVKHTGLRSFKCTVCSKAFCRAKTLRDHMKIHNDVRRFKCEHCGQAFIQKCSWRYHLRSKHGDIM